MYNSIKTFCLLSIFFASFAYPENTESIRKFQEQISKKETLKTNALDMEGYDFRKHRDLSHFNFAAANLKDANFEDMDLEGTNFKDANLENANFMGATISGCNFKGASLKGAKFQKTNIIRTNFHMAKLRHTHFEEAKIKASNFDGSQMFCVFFDKAIIKQCNFNDATARGLSLKGTSISASNREDAIWESDVSICKPQ